MCQGENSCCIQSWLVHQGPSCQATIQRCMGPSWQTAANEAEVVGRVRVLQKRAMQPLFSCLTHLELHLQPPITLVLICTCNLIYFLPALRVLAECINSHVLHSPTFYTIAISLSTLWLIFTQKKTGASYLYAHTRFQSAKEVFFYFGNGGVKTQMASTQTWQPQCWLLHMSHAQVTHTDPAQQMSLPICLDTLGIQWEIRVTVIYFPFISKSHNLSQ